MQLERLPVYLNSGTARGRKHPTIVRLNRAHALPSRNQDVAGAIAHRASMLHGRELLPLSESIPSALFTLQGS